MRRWGYIFVSLGMALISVVMMPQLTFAADWECKLDAYNLACQEGYFSGINGGSGTMKPFSSSCDGISNARYHYVMCGHPLDGVGDGEKEQFIKVIMDQYNNPDADRNDQGAAFVVLTMIGADKGQSKKLSTDEIDQWKERIRSDDIKLDKKSSVDYGINSAYVKYEKNNTLDNMFYKDSDSATALVFSNKNTGKVYYRLKVKCVNPIGDLPGLPKVSDRLPTFDIAGNCQKITISNAKDDDKTGASLKVELYRGSTRIATGATSGGSWTYTFPSGSPSGTYTYKARVYSVNNDGSSLDTYTEKSTSVTCTVVTTGDCGPQVMASSIPVGILKKVTPTITLSGPAPADARFSSMVYLESSGASYWSESNINVSGSTVISRNAQFTPNTPGVYRIMWKLTSASVNIICYGNGNAGWTPSGDPDESDAGNQSYFEVKGGDTLALIAGDDASSGSKGVISWNNDNDAAYSGFAGYGGAASQLAALTDGDLLHYVTGAANVTGSLPSKLAFSNDPSTTADSDYGGNLVDAPYRSQGEYDKMLDRVTSDHIYGGGSVGSLDSGVVYGTSDDVTITDSSISAGKTITIVVKQGSNVYISGKVSYGSYTTVDDIPRFTIYTRSTDADPGTGGNIVVNGSVTELDGVYIAEGDGKFYSCGTSTTAYVTPDNFASNAAANYSDCNHPLLVRGMVSASKLVLMRTYGSWVWSNTAAETFSQGPETWLNSATPKSDFDSYISLPPVL